MKLKLLVAMMAVCVSAQSYAGFLIDPYIGSGTYGTTLDAASLESDGEKMNVIGSRLGYKFILLSAGIDYEMDTLGSDSSRTNVSGFVGVDLPILLRFWAEYMISSDLKSDDLDTAGIDIAFDSGYSIGVGFTGLPFVSINLEFEQSKYTFENIQGVGDLDADWASYTISLSFPIDL